MRDYVKIAKDIINKAKKIYEENGDLGYTCFIFLTDDVYEIPLCKINYIREILKRPNLEALMIAGIFEVREDDPLGNLEYYGRKAIGCVFKVKNKNVRFFHCVIRDETKKPIVFGKIKEIPSESQCFGILKELFSIV